MEEPHPMFPTLVEMRTALQVKKHFINNATNKERSPVSSTLFVPTMCISIFYDWVYSLLCCFDWCVACSAPQLCAACC